MKHGGRGDDGDRREEGEGAGAAGSDRVTAGAEMSAVREAAVRVAHGTGWNGDAIPGLRPPARGMRIYGDVCAAGGSEASLNSRIARGVAVVQKPELFSP